MPDGRTVLYPSNLIFVESDAKASSAQLCGLKGVHSRNHGLIESLGDKVDRGAWAERVQSASELADSIQLAKRPSNSKSKATVSAYKKLKTESEVQTTPNEIMPKTLEVHEINYRNYTDTIIHETASALDLTHLEGTSPSTAATHIKEVKTERNTASPMPLEEDVAWWESRLPSTDINAYDVSWHAQRDSSEATHNGSITPTTPLVSLQQTSGIPTGATDATTPIPISVKPLPPEDNRVSLAQPSGEDASAPVTRYPSPSSSGLLGHGDSDVQFRLDDMDGLDGMNGVMFGDMNTGSAWGTNDYSDLENLGSMHVTEDDFSFFDDTPKPSQLMATNTMGRQFDQNSLLASGVHSRDSFAMDDKGLGDGLDSIDIDAMFDGPELTEMNKSESVGAPTVISEDIPSLTNTTNTVTSITEADEFDEQLSPQLNRPIVHVHSGNISVSISAEVDNIKCLAPCLPADYAPMRIMTGVNDAKYGYGGKFTLPMPKSMQRKVRSRIGYRPDYMPVTPFAVLQIKSQRKESLPTASLDYTQVHSEGRFAELSSATEVSESDSGDYSVSDQEPESNDIEEDINQANEAARSAYLHLMQRYSGSEEPEHRTQQSRIAQEFDTPFVDCVASTDAFSKTRQKSEFEGDLYLRSLDILCEQAVLGGYPFSGGLADINTRGGEVVDGDFPHTFGARWFSMLNTTTNSPSKIRTVDEEQGLILAEVKEVLASTFDPNFIAPEVWANSFGEDDTTRHTVPASVSIKGPLTLQQYCDLTEANPTQSKYGKWQVKKKRPVEPSIYALDTPEVVVGLKDDWLVTSPHILRFWEKARLEPYSAKKGVVYFVVCPQNPVLEASVTNFLTELSAIYDACSLGIHQPGTAGEFKSGLVPVALLPEIDGEAQEDRELRSYMAACQKLGATLGPMLTDKFHVVVYMLNPFRHKSAYLDLSHCFAKLLHAYDIASMAATARLGNKIRQRVVLQFLPVEHVLRSSAFGGYLKFGLEDIAFSVYNKCSRTLERSEGRVRFEQNKEVAEFYSPAYVLARSKQPSVLFKLKGALRDFPVVTSDQTFLHLAYTWSADKRWLLAVWTDGCGELTDFATYTLDSVDSDETSDPWEFVRDVFASLWRKSLLFSKRAGLSWRFVIGKLGSMFEAELQQWIKVIPVEQHVDIVALEPDAMLQFSPNMDLSSSEFIPSTPASGGAVTPDALGLPGASPQPSKMEAVQKRNDDIIALLLNHRATVSSRDTFYLGPQGVTPPEHSASEILMVPLATGYMVRLPTKQTSQVRNLACTSPFTIELHLLYTKLNHPPQSVLRTIIKQCVVYVRYPMLNVVIVEEIERVESFNTERNISVALPANVAFIRSTYRRAFYAKEHGLTPYMSDQALALILPVVLYWVYSLFFHVMSSLEIPAFERYRIHDPEELKKNKVSQAQVIRGVLLQQFLQTLLGLAMLGDEPVKASADSLADTEKVILRLATRILGLWGNHMEWIHLGWIEPLARLLTYLVFPAAKLLVAMIILDTYQYFFHRLFHTNRFLYKHIHSHHHRLYVPYAFGALYNHPLEGFIMDSVGASLAFWLSGLGNRGAIVFFTFSTLKTVDDHCGYHFPWDPLQCLFPNNVAYHDIHHQSFGIKKNFSQPFFTWWDALLGTKMDRRRLQALERSVDAKVADAVIVAGQGGVDGVKEL
ncbi:hypothetical protein BZG36_03292, partial [Bifiguratus adelaidae]